MPFRRRRPCGLFENRGDMAPESRPLFDNTPFCSSKRHSTFYTNFRDTIPGGFICLAEQDLTTAAPDTQGYDHRGMPPVSFGSLSGADVGDRFLLQEQFSSLNSAVRVEPALHNVVA